MTRRSKRSSVPDRVADLLKATPPFEWLSDELRDELVGALLVEYFEPDEHVALEDDDGNRFLCIVESGCIRLVERESGELLDLCGEGDTAGSEFLISQSSIHYDAVTSEPTVCALLPSGAFRKVFEASDEFCDFFQNSIRPAVRARQVVDAIGERQLFGSKVASVIVRRPVACKPDLTVREAAVMMRDEAVNSILVVRDSIAVGIVTESDLRNKVVANGAPYDTSVSEIMNSPLITVPSDTLIFEALMIMSRNRVHHLVVSEGGKPDGLPTGVICEQDIARAGGRSPAATLKRIEKALTVAELAVIRKNSTRQMVRLLYQGVQPEDIMEVITEINDRITMRLLHLAEKDLAEKHPGPAVPLRWTWLTLGSKGRREMGLSGDQDNAILYEAPDDPEAEADALFRLKFLARRVNLGLSECGFPFCKGKVMATNSEWCQSMQEWKDTIRRWILDPQPSALMHANVFFDLCALYGDTALADELKQHICDTLRNERGFLAFLAHNAAKNRPPLSFFRQFLLERSGEYRDSFDIKLHGLTPLVDIGRIMALESRFMDSTNTLVRLSHAGKVLEHAEELSANASDAFKYLLDLRLRHHLSAIEAGKQPDNHIHPGDLSKTQRKVLRAVFSAVEETQSSMVYRYGAQMMRQ